MLRNNEIKEALLELIRDPEVLRELTRAFLTAPLGEVMEEMEMENAKMANRDPARLVPPENLFEVERGKYMLFSDWTTSGNITVASVLPSRDEWTTLVSGVLGSSKAHSSLENENE